MTEITSDITQLYILFNEGARQIVELQSDITLHFLWLCGLTLLVLGLLVSKSKQR